ncbi:hypothetical protein DFJ74DRAFT_623708, partial [Hyaloraphidium curvatum]
PVRRRRAEEDRGGDQAGAGAAQPRDGDGAQPRGFRTRHHALRRRRGERPPDQGVCRLWRPAHHHEPLVRAALQHRPPHGRPLRRHRRGRGHRQDPRPGARGADQGREELPGVQLRRGGGGRRGPDPGAGHAQEAPGDHRPGGRLPPHPRRKGALPRGARAPRKGEAGAARGPIQGGRERGRAGTGRGTGTGGGQVPAGEG